MVRLAHLPLLISTALGATALAQDVEELRRILPGHWQMTGQPDCARFYPDRVMFRAAGLYEAPGAPEAGKLWQSGDFELPDEQTIVIQVANDAMVGYRIRELTETRLTLEDQNGCVFSFDRVSE